MFVNDFFLKHAFLQINDQISDIFMRFLPWKCSGTARYRPLHLLANKLTGSRTTLNKHLFFCSFISPRPVSASWLLRHTDFSARLSDLTSQPCRKKIRRCLKHRPLVTKQAIHATASIQIAFPKGVAPERIRPNICLAAHPFIFET
jgi:hypothetical protein